jgi:hypothetical protein
MSFHPDSWRCNKQNQSICVHDDTKSKQELRSFLGLANFYRRFVPYFAQIAKPLTEMTREDNPEQLTINTEAKTAF